MASKLSSELESAFADAGHRLLGCYETDPTPNNFPRLPIRTDTAFVWFTTSRQPTQAGPTTLSGTDLLEVAKALGPVRQSPLDLPSPRRHIPVDTHRTRRGIHLAVWVSPRLRATSRKVSRSPSVHSSLKCSGVVCWRIRSSSVSDWSWIGQYVPLRRASTWDAEHVRVDYPLLANR